MAYVSITSITHNSISVNLSGMDLNYTKPDRVCYWYLDGYRQSSVAIDGGISTGAWYTFNNLIPSTSYNITAIVIAPGWATPAQFYATAKTTIKHWSWFESNGSASSIQTQTAYNAIANNGKITDFSHLVWNDLVSKVYEIIVSKGKQWNNRYCSYNSTKMSVSDRTLTAERFNSLRYNIDLYYKTGINEVYKGDTVYAWYFITFTYCLNSIIG